MLDKYKQRQRNYKECFGSPEGKEVLKDLFKACKVSQTFITDNARKDAYNEGRKSIFLYITNIMKQDLNVVLQETEGVL